MKSAAALLAGLACTAALAEQPKAVNVVYQCDDKKIVVVEQVDPLSIAKPGKTMKLTIGYDEHQLTAVVVATGHVYRNDDGDVEWSTRNGENGELTDPRDRKKLATNCKVIK